MEGRAERGHARKKTDAAADASGEDAVPFSPSSGELEDVGDVALAAVSLLRRKTAEEPPPTSPPTPSATISDQGSTPESLVAEAGPARLPPGWEFTLEYYEAKARYMAAQEAAHGMSAAKIQASSYCRSCEGAGGAGDVRGGGVFSLTHRRSYGTWRRVGNAIEKAPAVSFALCTGASPSV